MRKVFTRPTSASVSFIDCIQGRIKVFAGSGSLPFGAPCTSIRANKENAKRRHRRIFWEKNGEIFGKNG
jgi:hypothetical protein